MAVAKILREIAALELHEQLAEEVGEGDDGLVRAFHGVAAPGLEVRTA